MPPAAAHGRLIPSRTGMSRDARHAAGDKERAGGNAARPPPNVEGKQERRRCVRA